MPRLATPLSDLKCRTAKPRDRAYKLFDGGGMYLYVAPSGSKTWRLRYFKSSGKEGTLIAVRSQPGENWTLTSNNRSSVSAPASLGL